MKRYISGLIMSFVIAAYTLGCESSTPERAQTVATISNPQFVKGLDTITHTPNSTLVLVGYWNDWQAIVRSTKNKGYQAYIWNGHEFHITNNSPLTNDSLGKDVYDHLKPLGRTYTTASRDYSQVLAAHKSWKLQEKTFEELPVPALVAIELHGVVRPMWLFPYRLWPHDGNAAVLADTGTLINSVKLDKNGLRAKNDRE